MTQFARRIGCLLALALLCSAARAQCPPGNVSLSSQAQVDNFAATFPDCEDVQGILGIFGTVTDLSPLATIRSVADGLTMLPDQLTTATFAGLQSIGGDVLVTNAPALSSLNFPALVSVDGDVVVTTSPSLTSLNAPMLTSISGDLFFEVASLTALSLQNLASVESILTTANSLTSVNLPALVSIEEFGVFNASTLVSIDLRQVTSLDTFVLSNNASLSSIDLRNLTSAALIFVSSNPMLGTCCFLASALQSADPANVTIADNAPGCSSIEEVLRICVAMAVPAVGGLGLLIIASLLVLLALRFRLGYLAN